MSNIRYYLLVMFLNPLIALTQIQQISEKLPIIINFISDTQQPMQVEQIVLKSNQNTRATSLLFSDILKNKPSS